MLENLAKYAMDHDLEAEPGFKPKDIKWAIAFDKNGRFLDVIELGDTSQKKNKGECFSKCPDLSQPEMKAGGVTKSHFLVDSNEVIALFGPKAQEKKSVEKHRYFIQLIRKAAGESASLETIANALADERNLALIRDSLQKIKAKPSDKATFSINNKFPVKNESWHSWWREFRRSLKTGGEEYDVKEGGLMRCYVSGNLEKPLKTHPKISGLSDVGGLPTGDALISFKQESFSSYGLSQSENAAVCEVQANQYRAALDSLIRNSKHRFGDTKIIHWFKQEVSDAEDPTRWIEEGESDKEFNAKILADNLLSSIRAGKKPELADNYYYAMTLSGASGRIVVRDWMEGRFEDLVESVKLWFSDMEIISRDGNGYAKSPKFYAVLGSTVRDLKDVNPPFASKMWRAAATGEPIQISALVNAVNRFKVAVIKDEAISHAGTGLIRACLVRDARLKGGINMPDVLKPELNEGHPNPAYQCGRLMAVLAGLQRSALGDVGSGVVQRYYAAASSTPALVMGRITRMSQFHIGKLEGGLANWYEKKISDIWSNLSNGIPKTLTLEEQSMFAMGYYQQMAEMRKRKTVKCNTEEVENE